jgi:hypothetical protein
MRTIAGPIRKCMGLALEINSNWNSEVLKMWQLFSQLMG